MNREKEILEIPISEIIPNRFQPRLAFDDQALAELASSIKEHGVIQPLVLRRVADKYEIIAGERRYKASQIAGLQTVPAVIMNIDDNESAEVALIENVQRKDLSAIEEAKSYKSLLDRGYLTQEQLAKRLGLSQPSIANKLRLLNLSDEVQKALLEQKISERHARSLLTVADKTKQTELLNKVLNERLTVKQLDEIIKNNYQGESVEDDIPLVDLVPNIDDILSKTEDIKTEEVKKDTSSPITISTIGDTEPIVQSQNKFFNFLENEAASLNTTQEPIIKSETIADHPEEEKTILPEPAVNPIPFVEEPEKSINPFLANSFPTSNSTVDPMNLVNNLEEVKVEQTETTEKNNMVTSINLIRDLKKTIENMGLTVDLEEADTDASYHITIDIKKP